jgi:hypothetical protein
MLRVRLCSLRRPRLDTLTGEDSLNVFTVEEYQSNGKTGKRWTNIGTAFIFSNLGDLTALEIEAFFFTFTLAERQLIEDQRRPTLKLGLALQIRFCA